MPRRSRFFYVRVSVLLGVLLFVIAYAVEDVRSRRERKAWDHELAVAVIVVRKPGLADASVDALRARAPALETRLEGELHRYRPGAPTPFAFTVLGPIDVADAMPVASGDGILDLAKHTWNVRGWTKDVDARAGVDASRFDSRIYVLAEPPTGKKHMVEGSSEQGGRIGMVAVDLDDLTTDFALAVIAHELFHTLDATDKYGADGLATVPDGLAEPDLSPRYPQRFVEIMTRGRPTSPSSEKVLDTLADLAVGPATAREIGWAR